MGAFLPGILPHPNSLPCGDEMAGSLYSLGKQSSGPIPDIFMPEVCVAGILLGLGTTGAKGHLSGMVAYLFIP